MKSFFCFELIEERLQAPNVDVKGQYLAINANPVYCKHFDQVHVHYNIGETCLVEVFAGSV